MFFFYSVLSIDGEDFRDGLELWAGIRKTSVRKIFGVIDMSGAERLSWLHLNAGEKASWYLEDED